MTRKPTALTGTREQFPDFRPRDDMQNPIYLHRPTHIAALDIDYGNPDTILVIGEVPVAWSAGIIEQRGYAIDREGKPPDFALEVASASTSVTDYTESTATTSATEYRILGMRSVGGWYHDTALGGDRLIDGSYHPIGGEWTGET